MWVNELTSADGHCFDKQVIVLIGQFENACPPIDSTDSPKVIEHNEMQFANVSEKIASTELETSTDDK